MSGWRVAFKPAALRALSKLPASAREQIAKALDRLAFELSNPREARRSNVKAMLGAFKGQYRLRAGEYRVRYAMEGERLVILVLHAGHRRDVYRD